MEEVQVNGSNQPTEESKATTNGQPSEFVMPTAKLGEVKVTDYMRECLDKVASSEGFRNYDINVVHGSGIGDGFIGILFKVTIQEIDSDKKLSLALKTPPDNVARRTQFGAMELFQREVYMYNVVLPEFVKFQEERKIKKQEGFFEFPKCYFAEYNVEKDDAILIMEDLKENGYKMWDKHVPTNYEHTKLIVSALGRLHAISLAMKVQKPEVFEEFKKLNDVLTERMTVAEGNAMMVTYIEKARATLAESNVKGRARVQNLKDNFVQMMRDVMNPELSEPFTVVTHGDCWSNNFMYQYKKDRPEKIILLDWQISRYCSPVLDLVYFFFACTDKAMRKQHYEELLNLYHRSLKDLLEKLGGDAMSQFPFTALLRQLKQNGKFGLMMASTLIPLFAVKNEDLPDMDFMAENIDKNNPEKMEEMMKQFIGRGAGYEGRLRDMVEDVIHYGYL